MPASIIIPQKTNSQMTLDLVRQIHEYEPDSEVIVIHDTQDDEMAELPDCRLIRNRGVGVTAAWNHGVEEAKHEHVILLNNDVVCSGPFSSQLEIHAASGIAGVAWRKERLLGLHARFLPGGGDGMWVQGWCFSFLKSIWRRLGPFDESMVLYFSDLDFQIAVVRNGMDLVVVRNLPLEHLGHRTTRQTPGTWDQWGADRRTFKRKLEASAK